MVSSKKVHCAHCQKKCSGNVLRYQDQYYHKQCFELAQSDSLAASQANLSPGQSNGQLQSETASLGQRSSSSSRQNLPVSSSAYFMSDQPSHRMSPTTRNKSQTIDARFQQQAKQNGGPSSRAATLPHSISSPSNGAFVLNQATGSQTMCAGCRERISDGQALIALDVHWHVWCFKCAQCKTPLHGEYVAKDNKAYCERDYQKLFGITCVYCKRYITGKVLQAGEAHHFHPSCARCSKCGDPFVPGEEMYLQGEVTWHPRCGPNPNGTESVIEADDRSQLRAPRARSPSLSSRSRSRSASPFSYMSRQFGGRTSPAYADSEAVGDLSRVYTISYLNADPNQGYLRRPVEPNPPKSPQFSRPTSLSRLGGVSASERSRCSSRSQYGLSRRDCSVPRRMYSVLSSMRSGSSSRARSPSMMNEEAIQLAAYPGAQKPSPDSVPKIERDDFPAPPFPYPDRHHSSQQQPARSQTTKRTDQTEAQELDESNTPVKAQAKKLASQPQERASRPRSREVALDPEELHSSSSSADLDPQFSKEEQELSKIANGIGKIFLQTLKEREKLRAWKRANLDPRNASRTPSATRELPNRMRYDNPTNASPSRDIDRPRPWEEEEIQQAGEHSPTRTRSSLGRPGGASSALSSSYGYKVVQSNRSTPKPGYGLTNGPYASNGLTNSALLPSELSFAEQQRIAQTRAADLLGRGTTANTNQNQLQSDLGAITKTQNYHTSGGSTRSLASAAHFRRSMPNVANLHNLHQEGPPKLYPYHLLATSNYRLPPDVDRCHLERHLSNEEFQYIFHCDRLDFYRLPEWKRNELKRRARLF